MVFSTFNDSVILYVLAMNFSLLLVSFSWQHVPFSKHFREGSFFQEGSTFYRYTAANLSTPGINRQPLPSVLDQSRGVSRCDPRDKHNSLQPFLPDRGQAEVFTQGVAPGYHRRLLAAPASPSALPCPGAPPLPSRRPGGGMAAGTCAQPLHLQPPVVDAGDEGRQFGQAGSAGRLQQELALVAALNMQPHHGGASRPLAAPHDLALGMAAALGCGRYGGRGGAGGHKMAPPLRRASPQPRLHRPPKEGEGGARLRAGAAAVRAAPVQRERRVSW